MCGKVHSFCGHLVASSVSAVSVLGMLWAGSLLLSFEGSKYYMVGGMWVIVDGGK